MERPPPLSAEDQARLDQLGELEHPATHQDLARLLALAVDAADRAQLERLYEHRKPAPKRPRPSVTGPRQSVTGPRQSFTGPLLKLPAEISTAEVLPPQAGTGRQKTGRKSHGLKLLELKLDPKLAEIRKRTAIERKAFASVPKFLCCVAMPASKVFAPPQQWPAWARQHGAPPLPVLKRAKPGAAPRVTQLAIRRWAKWADEHKIPVPTAHSFVRESGPYRLEMYSSETFGCPYGAAVYDIIVGIATYVQQMKNQKVKDQHIDTRLVYFGDTFNEGMKNILGTDYLTGGRTGNASRFMDQYHALMNSRILWWPDKTKKHDYVKYDFSTDEALPAEVEKHILWRTNRGGMSIYLGYWFHLDCLKSAPVDYGVYRLLRKGGNCMCLAIYLWLNMRSWVLKQTHRVEMPGLSWDVLMVQFGGDRTSIRHFRRDFLHALDRVAEVYPKMEFEEREYGYGLNNKKLHITLKDTPIASAFTGITRAADYVPPNFQPPPVEQLSLTGLDTEIAAPPVDQLPGWKRRRA